MKNVVVKNFTLRSLPGRSGRRYYDRRGLAARRIGPSEFLVRRQDGGEFDSRDLLEFRVAILPPWSDEKVKIRAAYCEVHGSGCGGKNNNCEVRWKTRVGPRWFVRMVSADGSRAHVCLFRQGFFAARGDAGAGFAVSIVVKDEVTP